MDLDKEDDMFRSLQIDLLRGYHKQNVETDLLYFDFNMKAKILYVANAVSR